MFGTERRGGQEAGKDGWDQTGSDDHEHRRGYEHTCMIHMHARRACVVVGWVLCRGRVGGPPGRRPASSWAGERWSYRRAGGIEMKQGGCRLDRVTDLTQ